MGGDSIALSAFQVMTAEYYMIDTNVTGNSK